jgi:hypothetical protein
MTCAIPKNSFVLAFKLGPGYCTPRCFRSCAPLELIHVEPVFRYECAGSEAAVPCDVCLLNNNTKPTTHLKTLVVTEKDKPFWQADKHCNLKDRDKDVETWRYIVLKASEKELEAMQDFLTTFVPYGSNPAEFNYDYKKNYYPIIKYFKWGVEKNDNFLEVKKWYCSELVTAMFLHVDFMPQCFGDLQPRFTSPEMLLDICMSMEGVHEPYDLYPRSDDSTD